MNTPMRKPLLAAWRRHCRAVLTRSLLLAGSLLLSLAARASTLTNVEFNALEGGRFEARLQFEGVPPDVKGYSIEKPARIALDLVGVENKLSQKKFPLSYDNASSAIVVEAVSYTHLTLPTICSV